MINKHHLKDQGQLGYIKLAKIYKKVYIDTTGAIMGGQTEMKETLSLDDDPPWCNISG
jgi:hypothetical protein